jgi:HSP20 family protein
MAAMRTVGNGHQLPAHANVHERPDAYVIELDVADFTDGELSVELLGSRVTVRGDKREAVQDEGKPFRLHGRLIETFRLPGDADSDRIEAFFAHGVLEIRAPRTHVEPRRLPIQRPAYGANPDAEPC